jgi:hypothetical protein
MAVDRRRIGRTSWTERGCEGLQLSWDIGAGGAVGELRDAPCGSIDGFPLDRGGIAGPAVLQEGLAGRRDHFTVSLGDGDEVPFMHRPVPVFFSDFSLECGEPVSAGGDGRRERLRWPLLPVDENGEYPLR